MIAKKVKSVQVLTERLQKLKNQWEEAEPQVYVTDSIMFTKSWKETEGLPIDLRWAKSFAKRLEETPLLIRNDEIIVGSLTNFVRGNGTVAAMKPKEILEMVEKGKFDRKTSDLSSTKIDPDDLRMLKEDAEYWLEHMPQVNPVIAAVVEDLGPEILDLLFDRGMVFEGRTSRANPDRGLFQSWGAFGGGVAQPSAKVIHHGLNYVIDLAKAELNKMLEQGSDMQGSVATMRKYYLLKSCILSCEAIIAWAKRHADLARSMAEKEVNSQRKEELLKIADICEWVPANAPRSYWEAVQSLRFLHLACWKESSDRPEVPVGRLDQILYPYYKKDVEDGQLTTQDAAELLGAFWLKIRETENLVTIKREHRAAPGTLLPNVTLGGVDENGNDLINEVSWLVLEVMSQIKLSEPAVYIRYHEDIDKEFLNHALECNVRFGGGNPAFLNDKLGTKRYVERGVKLEDAVNWNASGCLGYHLDCAEHMGGGFNFNQAKILELALYNGFDYRTGKQLGPKTGDITTFSSMEEIMQAYFKQVEYFTDKMRRFYFIAWGIETMTSPMSGLRCAMLYEDCIPAGLNSREGGARYRVCSASWFGDRGMVDLADSLAGIKYLVFDKKKVGMSEMLEAIKSNWEGFEELRQMCLNAPKYGNDDDYVDEIYMDLSLNVERILQSKPDPYSGEKPMLFKGAAAGHVTIGTAIGALPSGRLAGTPINDAASSAMPGMDVSGPTALINSATKAPYAKEYCGYAHNMKFSKAILNTPGKLEKVGQLIKTFMSRDGWHIQFNIHSREELLEAKKNPVEYKHLLVRVGGYSAYFIDLPPELQDEIVQRTMHDVM